MTGQTAIPSRHTRSGRHESENPFPSLLEETDFYLLGRFRPLPRVVRGGGETTRKIAVAFGASFVMLLMLAQPASAAILTGSIVDPVDANLWFNKKQAVPEYLDILGATLTLNTETGKFKMTMDTVGEIPAVPALFDAIRTVAWQWCFRTGEPDTHPFSHHLVTDEDYMVWVMWDGKAWSAQLWDFCHVQESGGLFQVRDIPFGGPDDGVSVTIDSPWMDDFQECQWAVGVKCFMSPPLKTDGFDGSFYVDYAGINPDGKWTSWPKPA